MRGWQGSSKRHCRGSWAGDERGAQSRTFYTWEAAHGGIGHPESSLPEGPRLISMEIGALPVPFPQPIAHWVVRGTRECLCPGAPTPSPRRGQGGQDKTWFPGGRTYRQASPPALEAQLPLAGKGVKRGTNVPAPPVPLHTGLLLLQHKAGDCQHVEEDHAHDVRDGVPLVLQALLEPAPELALSPRT